MLNFIRFHSLLIYRANKITNFLALIAVTFVLITNAQAGQRVPLIRDAEIERLLLSYTTPIFKAAGISSRSVKIYLVADNSINAFVTNGQRIFVNTGLLLKAKTPSEVIGVLAHEIGHIAGGHLVRSRDALSKASALEIVSFLLSGAAAVGSASKGSLSRGYAAPGASFGKRYFLAYQRVHEAAADQAALRYLNKAGLSARGLISMFQTFANRELASVGRVDPYLLSHPMSRERISLLDRNAKKSRYYNKKDSAEYLVKHRLIQAKLRGFMMGKASVIRYYGTKDKSTPARYARAIAYYRSGDIRLALHEINALLKTNSRNSYFWELKGQALYESGRVKEAIAPLTKAVNFSPRAGTIRLLLAQSMLSTGDNRYTDQAIRHLHKAEIYIGDSSELHRQLAIAYAKKGKIGKASLESAEAAVLSGDIKTAKEHAKRARMKLSKGSPGWVKAGDILRLKK